MKARRIISTILTAVLVALLLAGCGEKSEADEYFKDFTQDGEILEKNYNHVSFPLFSTRN